MNTIESLSIRTTAARSRLTELERRVEKTTNGGSVVKPALKELSAAIEELQVANEQLAQHVSELASTRHDVASLRGPLLTRLRATADDISRLLRST